MTKLVLFLSVVLLSTACDLSSTTSKSTDSSISGRFTYEGPPPLCNRGQLLGQFVFLLYQDPIRRPLEGVDAPIAIRTLDASFVFDATTDCDLDPFLDIERTQSYVLDRFGPTRTLLEETDFRLVVMYDHDDSYDPNDPIRSQPNREDVFGAAYTTVESRRFARLSFGPTAMFPDQRITDVDITVDALVHSEVPAFRVAPGTTALSSTAIMPNDDVQMDWEDQLLGLTDMRLEVLPADTEPWRTILDRRNIVFESDPPRGFWSRAVDPARTLGALRHPVFGVKAPAFRPAGLDWLTPFTVMKRVRSQAEQDTRVPEVFLVPLTRPSLEDKQVFSPTVDMLVPPVALVELDPELPTICQIPYMAPGNFADAFEDVPTECQELPTGDYEITIQHGVAGGVVNTVSTQFSDIGIRVDDDEYIGQSWTIPNALGTDLSDQGTGGYFRVVDIDPGSGPDPDATDAGHGVAECTNAPDRANAGDLRAIVRREVPLACCANIRHLCGIPLCDGESGVRSATSAGGGRPNCMPFLLPKTCCPAPQQ